MPLFQRLLGESTLPPLGFDLTSATICRELVPDLLLLHEQGDEGDREQHHAADEYGGDVDAAGTFAGLAQTFDAPVHVDRL